MIMHKKVRTLTPVVSPEDHAKEIHTALSNLGLVTVPLQLVVSENDHGLRGEDILTYKVELDGAIAWLDLFVPFGGATYVASAYWRNCWQLADYAKPGIGHKTSEKKFKSRAKDGKLPYEAVALWLAACATEADIQRGQLEIEEGRIDRMVNLAEDLVGKYVGEIGRPNNSRKMKVSLSGILDLLITDPSMSQYHGVRRHLVDPPEEGDLRDTFPLQVEVILTGNKTPNLSMVTNTTDPARIEALRDELLQEIASTEKNRALVEECLAAMLKVLEKNDVLKPVGRVKGAKKVKKDA